MRVAAFPRARLAGSSCELSHEGPVIRRLPHNGWVILMALRPAVPGEEAAARAGQAPGPAPPAAAVRGPGALGGWAPSHPCEEDEHPEEHSREDPPAPRVVAERARVARLSREVPRPGSGPAGLAGGLLEEAARAEPDAQEGGGRREHRDG